jgi:hypothetical protein
MVHDIPRSQGDLIRRARGQRTKTAFAKELGVDRTCLTRYENEQLGAPTRVLNFCLSAIAAHSNKPASSGDGLEAALALARQMVNALEEAQASRIAETEGSASR